MWRESFELEKYSQNSLFKRAVLNRIGVQVEQNPLLYMFNDGTCSFRRLTDMYICSFLQFQQLEYNGASSHSSYFLQRAIGGPLAQFTGFASIRNQEIIVGIVQAIMGVVVQVDQQ